MTVESSKQNAGNDLLVATFLLGEGTFGLDTTLIQEVVMLGEVTPVHHAPIYVAGIRNLRGRIVTVIDLRMRLELPPTETGPESRILIADWKGEPVGLLVDGVDDTIEVGAGDLLPPPSNLHGVQMQKLLGMFRCGERLAALLDPAAILDPNDRTGQSLVREETKK
jgi:purine-binding chemotaxis protein CheW